MKRGDHRLQIAGRLLRPECDGSQALERIKALPKEEAEELRGLVDWVEEYEHHEALTAPVRRD